VNAAYGSFKARVCRDDLDFERLQASMVVTYFWAGERCDEELERNFLLFRFGNTLAIKEVV